MTSRKLFKVNGTPESQRTAWELKAQNEKNYRFNIFDNKRNLLNPQEIVIDLRIEDLLLLLSLKVS